jgi:hypothetical protein
LLYYPPSLLPTIFLPFSSSSQVKSLTTQNTNENDRIALRIRTLLSSDILPRLQTVNRARPVELVYCLSNSWHHVNNNGQSNCHPVAAGQFGIQLLSNWLASNWLRVNRPLLINPSVQDHFHCMWRRHVCIQN